MSKGQTSWSLYRVSLSVPEDIYFCSVIKCLEYCKVTFDDQQGLEETICRAQLRSSACDLLLSLLGHTMGAIISIISAKAQWCEFLGHFLDTIRIALAREEINSSRI